MTGAGRRTANRRTLHVERVEENVRADAIELSAEQLRRLDSLPTPRGERYTSDGMAAINR